MAEPVQSAAFRYGFSVIAPLAADPLGWLLARLHAGDSLVPRFGYSLSGHRHRHGCGGCCVCCGWRDVQDEGLPVCCSVPSGVVAHRLWSNIPRWGDIGSSR